MMSSRLGIGSLVAVLAATACAAASDDVGESGRALAEDIGGNDMAVELRVTSTFDWVGPKECAGVSLYSRLELDDVVARWASTLPRHVGLAIEYDEPSLPTCVRQLPAPRIV